MSTLPGNVPSASAQACGLSVGQREFAVLLRDGRRVVVPFACFPRLERATPEQRRHFEVYADGKMLHWPDLDEDIEVQHIVDGRMPVKLAEAANLSKVAEPPGSYSVRRKK